MAFNFLSRLSRKEKIQVEKVVRPQSKEKVELETGELLEWINKEMIKEIEKERKKFTQVSVELIELVVQLQKVVENIKKKSFEAGDRTYAAVNMIKDTWVKKAMISFSLFRKEYREDNIGETNINYPVFRNLYHSTVRLMNETSMVPRQRLVLSRYFEKESNKMSEVLQSIGGIMGNMKEAVSGASALKSISRVDELLTGFNTISSQVIEMEKRKDNTNDEIARKESEITQQSENVESIENRPEWRKLKELVSLVENSVKEKEEIELAVSEKLGELKRIFKVYAHDSHALDKAEKRLLDDMAHSPMKAYTTNEAGPIENVLRKLNDDIRENRFKPSEKDAGKTKNLGEILDTGLLIKSKEMLIELKQKIIDAESKKENIKIIAEKNESRRMLDKVNAELDILKREKNDLEKEVKKKRGELILKKKEISELVKKELGSEIELN